MKKKKKKAPTGKAASTKGIPKHLRADAPAQPTEGAPVNYNGGRIYMSKGFFRVIRTAGQYGTERKTRISMYASVDIAWEASLRLVDAFRSIDVD